MGIFVKKMMGANGFGGKANPLPVSFLQAYGFWRKGLISMAEAARRYGMTRSTFRYRAITFRKGKP